MVEIDHQNHQQVIRKRRFLQRGESMVASAGLAVAAILLAAMGVSAWWVSRTYRQSFNTVQAAEIRAVGELLADTSQSLLEAGELTTLRRVIADTSRKYQLDTGPGNPFQRIVRSRGLCVAVRATIHSEIR